MEPWPQTLLAVPPRAGPTPGMAVVDAELRFLQVNEALAAMHGVPVAEHLGRTVGEVLPTLAPTIEPLIRRVFASGAPLLDLEMAGPIPTAPDRHSRLLVSFYPVHSRGFAVLAVEMVARPLATDDDAAVGEAFWQSLERLRLIVDTARLATWEWDLETGQVQWGGATAAVLGDLADTLTSTAAFVKHIPPEDLDTLRHTVWAARATGLPYNAAFRVVNLPGQVRWIAASGRWLPSPSGSSQRLAGIAADITAQKQLEAEQARLFAELQTTARTAEELAARLDTLVRTAPIGLAFLDTDLRFMLVNELLAAINGLPVEAHLGRTIRAVVPALADTAEPLFRQVLDTGAPLRSLAFSGETAAAPGLLRHWEEHAYPVRLADGRIVGLGVVVVEVTEQRRWAMAQALLATANGVLAPVLDETAAIDAIVRLPLPDFADLCVLTLLGDDGSVRRVGLAHRDPAKDLLARALWAEGAPEGGLPPGLARVIRQGATELLPEVPAEFAGLVAAAPEARRIVQALGLRSALTVPVRRGERIVGALQFAVTDSPRRFVPEDVPLAEELARRAALVLERAALYAAEHQARRQAEEAIRLRDTLVAQLAHDLKSPLTAVKGQAELLFRRLGGPEPPDPERLARGLGRIISAAAQMTAQIDQLLDSAQIRAGRPLELQCTPTDLVALARQHVEQYAAWNERHTLRLQTDLPALRGIWDEARLERVLDNLLGNAVKYSPSGGAITVTLAREADARGMWAVLTIADEGLGIPASELPRIFEQFHRGANVAEQIRGTGLGLSSARFIIEAHGGTIGAASEEGRGSTFTVRLPLAPDMVS